MKKILCAALIGLAMATARADTALTIPALYNCLTDFGTIVSIPNPPTALGTFNLNGVSGQGSVQSHVGSYWDEQIPPNNNEDKLYTYSYSIDLSGMSTTASHCVKLVIHFGDPTGCSGPGVQGSPSQIQSATLGPFGDITFVFNSGCLQPGQPAISFSMVSEAAYKTNIVTVIDDYYDPASGQTNELKVNVPAIVPDVPPDPPPWQIAYYYSRVHPVLFQGSLGMGTNQNGGTLPPTNGNYDLLLQLLVAPTNGPVVSQSVTQRVPVVNGLFTVPLPGEPTMYHSGASRYLSIGIKPAGGSEGFTQVNPPMPITPGPQALYAFSAGTVADISPDQAVLAMNGITGNLTLVPGPGIQILADGGARTITISQAGQPSDRNIKTDFAPVSAEKILAQLAALPISSWRYTNETASVRHVGPMAQDFKAAFDLGTSDKTIGTVDESGVALAALQGLNQKLNEKDAEIKQLQQSVVELRELVSQMAREKISPADNAQKLTGKDL
ncbi:MAG TPA: tail fiber domain-containing protein [Verrucomicrobiae bacterium]